MPEPFITCCGPKIGLESWRTGPGAEDIFVLEEGVKAAQAKAEKDAAGERATALTGDEDVGAGCAFGVGQRAVFLHDELAAEGNHEEHAQPAADQGEHEDAGVLQLKAEKDERGQGEDDAGGDGLASIARGLDDVVFKNGGAAESAEDADGEHGDGDRGGNGEAGAQAHVDGDSAEDDSEEGAEEDGSEREFGATLSCGNKGLKFRQYSLRWERQIYDTAVHQLL